MNGGIFMEKSAKEIVEQMQKDLSEELMNYKNDFFLQIYNGDILFLERGYKTIVAIKNEDDYYINFEGTKYEINQEILSNIKKRIEDNLDVLIKYSKMQTFDYLTENAPDGGMALSIHIKFGGLVINLNGNVVGEIGNACEGFIEMIREIVLSR